MIKVAITGNIASGKSQVEQYISKNGYAVFDTDIIAHDILDDMTDFYGYDVFTDGKIDRKKLGELVFSDNNIKKKLEEIIHPLVKDKILQLFEQHKSDKFVFISVPLLYEAGFESLFDKVLLITINPKLQLERLMIRNNFTEEQAKSRIGSQISQDYKINNADYIISNNGTLEDLYLSINKFLAQLGSVQ